MSIEDLIDAAALDSRPQRQAANRALGAPRLTRAPGCASPEQMWQLVRAVLPLVSDAARDQLQVERRLFGNARVEKEARVHARRIYLIIAREFMAEEQRVL